MSTPLTSDRRDWKTLAVLAVVLMLWASAFPGIRAGLHGYSAGELALLRYLVASVVLAVYFLFKKMPAVRLRDLPHVGAAGVLGFTLYNLALNRGEVRVSAAAASFILNTGPIFSALLAAIFLRERPKTTLWLGMAVSFAGTGIIALGEGGGFHMEASVFFVLAAAVAQASYFVVQKPLLQRYGALPLTAVAIWIGTLCMLPYLPGLIVQMPRAPLGATVAALYLGIFPSIVGYAGWAYVNARMPVATASAFLYLVPVIAVAAAWVWLGEAPSLVLLLGGGLSIFGVVLVKIRKKRQTPASRHAPITSADPLPEEKLL